jgi:hypothetical protein
MPFKFPCLISHLSDFHLLSHPAGSSAFIHSAGERPAGKPSRCYTGSGAKTNKHQ